MSSYYETKFDVIYRKLQDRKLNLKKEFDGAYSKDDFQASLGIMAEIQAVMSKLTALESVEKPFKQVASIVGQIEETKLEIEIHLEELGKLVKSLDEISVVLTEDLVEEMAELRTMFQEEDGKAFDFQFEKFTPDELMVLMRYDKKLFPSRHNQYEDYWESREKVSSDGPLATLTEDLSQVLPVTEAQAEKMDLVLETEDTQMPGAEASEEQPIDHGVQDLSDFGRQHHILENKQEDRRRLIEDSELEGVEGLEDLSGSIPVPPDTQENLMEPEELGEEAISAQDISSYEEDLNAAVESHEVILAEEASDEGTLPEDNLEEVFVSPLEEGSEELVEVENELDEISSLAEEPVQTEDFPEAQFLEEESPTADDFPEAQPMGEEVSDTDDFPEAQALDEMTPEIEEFSEEVESFGGEELVIEENVDPGAEGMEYDAPAEESLDEDPGAFSDVSEQHDAYAEYSEESYEEPVEPAYEEAAYQEDYSQEEYSEGEYAEEAHPEVYEESVAVDSQPGEEPYYEEGSAEYSDDAYEAAPQDEYGSAEADYSQNYEYQEGADQQGYEEYSEDQYVADQYAGDEYAQEPVDQAGYVEDYAAEVSVDSVEVAEYSDEVYADDQGYEEDPVYLDDIELEPVEQGISEEPAIDLYESETSDLSMEIPLAEDSSEDPISLDDISTDLEDSSMEEEPVAEDFEISLDSEETPVAIGEESQEVGAPAEDEDLAIDLDEIEIDGPADENFSLELNDQSDFSSEEGDVQEIDLDEIQIDLDEEETS